VAILDVRDVGVRFGGVEALREVSFHVNAGEVTGLIGPNGAGKTTLFNVISGLQSPQAGKVFFEGRDVGVFSPDERSRLGIGRTFQAVEVFADMTVEENVMIAREVRESSGALGALLRLPWARMEARRSEERVRPIFHHLGLEPYREAPVGDLPLGIQRRVELARALAGNPKLLLLDEPASGMDTGETRELAEDLRWLRRTFRITVLLVEHDMRFVMGLCDYIYVLNFGRLIAEGRPAEVRANALVIEAYLGAEGERQVGASRA